MAVIYTMELCTPLKYMLVVVKYVFESRMDFRKVGYVSSAYFVNEVKKRGESL